MFTLVSGLPGSGKSLNTIKLVEKERIREDGTKRPVYYWGIPELALDWIPLHGPDSTADDARARYDKGVSAALPADAYRWYEVPAGSIIVIDECQYVFPKLTQKQASSPPAHYAQLAIHRHSGSDLYCMTQHPSLIAVEARRQVQRHWHLERPFGLDYTNRLAWERCMSPDDRAARAQADVAKLTFDKSVFGYYRSAEVHTVKKRLPWKKMAVAVGGLVAVVGLFTYAILALTGGKDAEPVPVASGGAAPGAAVAAVSSWSAESFVPRALSWPWSAPFYDQVASVASAPRVIGCMSMVYDGVETCRCHTGQGEASVSYDYCKAYMRGQVFDPLREYVDIKAENIKRLEASESRGSGGSGETSSGAYVSPRKSET